ncbi:MAG: hypothetical protein JOZ94_13600 [Xanthobacteraceae bacterium]|nr:hypothetical protein [Xanthobacteraceae bacterium]MBV9628450.1 hypothetical protein [Xanthobacteraceae bacterium]
MRRNVESPSSNPPCRNQLFTIGRNSQGQWIVRDQSGLRGGLFINRTEALRFALFQNGHQPQAVLMVPETLELDLDPGAQIDARSDLERKAA